LAEVYVFHLVEPLKILLLIADGYLSVLSGGTAQNITVYAGGSVISNSGAVILDRVNS
jgi:autotransporter passenger strand-loop-strand repeat protein